MAYAVGEVVWAEFGNQYFSDVREGVVIGVTPKGRVNVQFARRKGETSLKQFTKSGKELAIRIHSALAEIFAETPKTLSTILADHKGRPRQPATIRGQIKAWLTKQGRPDLRPHGLRKNGILALFEAGCTVPETASISGQSLTMVEHYWSRWNADKLADNAMRKWNAME